LPVHSFFANVASGRQSFASLMVASAPHAVGSYAQGERERRERHETRDHLTDLADAHVRHLLSANLQ